MIFTLDVFKLDKFIFCNEVHPLNKSAIKIISDVSKFDKSISVIFEQSLNNELIEVGFLCHINFIISLISFK